MHLLYLDLPLVFISPTSKKFLQKYKNIFRLPFSCSLLCLLEVVIMSDFGMAETDDGRTPKMGSSTNLDAKTFVLGHGNIIGKSVIQEFFNCIGTLAFDDAPILKETKNYADAISALVLKLERGFIHTHPTLQRLFYELPVIKKSRAKKIATLVFMNEFDHIVREAREIFDFYGMNREKPVIDEILYNNDYLLRYLFRNDHIFDENIKK